MASYPKCSLITSTYNWPEALELLLLSIKNQSYLPNEVIIADDGSGNETAVLIKTFQKDFPVPLHHIWHKAEVNEKPKILNKAIAVAKYEYIIEVDGDIIIHKDFIRDHLSLAEKNVYLYGSRATIQKKYLKNLFKKKQITFNFFSKGILKRGRTLRIPFLAKRFKKETIISPKLRGCNMSFWRANFIKVNRFNEVLVGWGMDDSEMIQRLINSGVKGKRIKFMGLVYHIYHKKQDKSKIKHNQLIEQKSKEENSTYITKGIDQYIKN